ncbi:uncharacterized protein TNCV_3624141 [Trichonephila clavipes]|nr:uncharacterized protein TNCV_3624141 [Trichonephila clavipes]
MNDFKTIDALHTYISGFFGKKAEELSSIVGSAFRMAYAQQLQQPRQLEPRPARRRSPGPVQLGPPGLHVTCRDDRSPKPAARACWDYSFSVAVVLIFTNQPA